MNKVKFFLAIVCGAVLVACSEEESRMPTGQTGIQVALTEQASVETRATPGELAKPLAENFHLKIMDVAGKPVYDGSYTSELIPASVGTYTLEATCGENPELALDDPYYKGEVEAEVTDGEPEKVTITCKVANALASAEFSHEGVYKFEDQFSSYGIKVEVGSSSTTLTTVGESAYYRAGSSPTFTFVGILKDGEEIKVPLKHEKFSQDSTFAAGAHCIITLKLGASTPGVRVEVSKVEVKDVTINETIPMEWLPKPKVVAEGFDVNNALTFVETESKEAKLNLNLSSALQDIKLKFDFEDLQFASLNEQEEYLLSKDKATLEEALGITLPNIGETKASIDLSALIDKLQTNAGTTTTNSISIDVQANNRWSSEDKEKNLNYTLTCNKPEFSVAVQEGNCWSKTFVIDEPTISSGNADILKSKLVYQYKEKGADDGSWQTCSNGLEQVFSDYPDKKEYQVRAFYREGITSNVVDVTLETPTQIPNSDMEEWITSTRTVRYGLIRYNQPFFQPWSGSIQWWDTNNIMTMPTNFDIVGQVNRASFPSVTFTQYGYSGRGAVIRSIGHGRSNSGVAKGTKTRGILYVGTTNGDGGMTEGQDWYSRPGALSFYYKYNSIDNERFGVYLELYSGNEQIASGFYVPEQHGVSVGEYTLINVPITYINTSLKATEIRIRFCSVAEGENPEVEGSEVDVPEGSGNYYEIWGGSVLYIDNIVLSYNK